MEVKEFEIPVPWGHVAVKAWGNVRNACVFVTHGVMDNAGMFDRLIPLLPDTFYYVCIDLPGHGKSSRYPPYLLITPLDMVFTYKLVLDYLNRRKYIFMGHSWGGQIQMLYTQLYPNYVLKLILLDAIYLYPLDPKIFKNYWTFRIDGLMKINEQEKSGSSPEYTYEEALDRIIRNRVSGSIIKHTAQNLLKRSLIPVGDEKFRFSSDPRLKVYTLLGADMRFMIGLAKKHPLRCPMLIIKALQSNEALEEFTPLLHEMKKIFPHCRVEEVAGGHNDISDNPKEWAELTSKFLVSAQPKL